LDLVTNFFTPEEHMANWVMFGEEGF
jgi:hypothetical protein